MYLFCWQTCLCHRKIYFLIGYPALFLPFACVSLTAKIRSRLSLLSSAEIIFAGQFFKFRSLSFALYEWFLLISDLFRQIYAVFPFFGAVDIWLQI